MEDEPKLANLLRKGLTAQGLAADIATDGDEATWMATATAYDAITLDVMLPNTDGFTLCRELRRQGVTTPVLMITALDTIHDRVTGLEAAPMTTSSSHSLLPNYSPVSARWRADPVMSGCQC